jgi:hypothetical protein
MSYDFHRQKPIDNYIVDFFCSKLMLAIELDGYTHSFEEIYEKDKWRIGLFNGSIQDIEFLATFVWLSFRLVRNPSDIMLYEGGYLRSVYNGQCKTDIICRGDE